MTSQLTERETKERLADEVANLVYGLTRAWDARLDAAVAGLREREGIALTSRQGLAVWHLRDPLSMGELAAVMVCDQSNVTGIVDRLERVGLLVRQVDGDDRRVKRLVLTDAGKRLRRKLDALLGAESALASLSVDQLRTLRDLLTVALAVSTPVP